MTHHCKRTCLSILLLFATALVAWSQSATDFSDVWKQDNGRCQPMRKGVVTLRIEHHDRDLTVETSISPGSPNSRHAVQKYAADGGVTVTTGADGDEFYTSVVLKEASLVFSIEEHENGRVLRSTETWSLIENGSALQRIRNLANGEKQVLFYRRQQLQTE